MDPHLLKQFRQQLAAWIETRLESQRLPFQRLELCPTTLTDLGPLKPDLVLWINRDSLLAGSMILLPDVVNAQFLAQGVALCNALGLGHFTTWAAREVSIWQVTSGQPNRQYSLPLPPANRVTPEDFQNALDDLLERLKITTVTCAPTTSGYSEYYFANLCLRNLQELTPGLTISARMLAGEKAADAWVEHAPREKAWMSLWRILFLLWHGRLPPGLQPERLELAIHYALADLTVGQLTWLEISESEPPLPEDVAIRLHHLASRLRQLGWPRDDKHAHQLLCLLLDEAARSFELSRLSLPWCTEDVKLHVKCQPSSVTKNSSLVAPRVYIAGWAFKTVLEDHSETSVYREALQTLDSEQHFSSTLAVLNNSQSLNRKERDDRLIFFRQVWPSRRFDLPNNAPAWLWDVLHLVGLASEELSLVFPLDWHHAPGILTLWEILSERYDITDITESESGEQSLHLIQSGKEKQSVRVHRGDLTLDIPLPLLGKPGTTQVWLKASADVVKLLCTQSMQSISSSWREDTEKLTWGLFIFLHTLLGRYLWELCSDRSALPELEASREAVLTFGMPIPNDSTLLDLSMLAPPGTQVIPNPEYLEREFTGIFGPVPPLPESTASITTATPKSHRRGRVASEQIKTKVFQDGVPRFPEHYLMRVYRPTLIHYELFGPLEIAEEFFERISLRTIGHDHTIEVSGKIVAEALVLASYNLEKKVSLPENESLLAELVLEYQTDLERLWETLTSECRLSEPHRQAAIKLARKIWRQQGLPPVGKK